jgi:iron complex transport system permease protein
MIIAVSVGPVDLSTRDSMTGLLEAVGIGDSTATATEQLVIERIRLPRIILAMLVGAALGISGAAMQSLFRNPLADPGIIGVSSGGALGAVIAISIGAQAASGLFLPLFSFVGAFAATALVYGIASAGGRTSMATLLLAGVAVSSFLGAIVSGIITLTSSSDIQREIIFWLAGGFDSAGWDDVQISLPLIFAGVAVVVANSRELNLLMLGDDEASSLGVRTTATRVILLVGATLATGTAVAFSGTIAFVGLVVPHMLRLVMGPDNRVLLPLSALGGAAFMLGADTIARTLVTPAEVRVGIITAFIGAPFFLFLLARNRARAEAL